MARRLARKTNRKGARGARGAKGVAGPPGPPGPRGAQGERGKRGFRGHRGTLEEQITRASEEILDIRQNLLVQLKRIAQIQQQLDELRAAVKKKPVE
jgi:hypothetical protein